MPKATTPKQQLAELFFTAVPCSVCGIHLLTWPLIYTPQKLCDTLKLYFTAAECRKICSIIEINCLFPLVNCNLTVVFIHGKIHKNVCVDYWHTMHRISQLQRKLCTVMAFYDLVGKNIYRNILIVILKLHLSQFKSFLLNIVLRTHDLICIAKNLIEFSNKQLQIIHFDYPMYYSVTKKVCRALTSGCARNNRPDGYRIRRKIIHFFFILTH